MKNLPIVFFALCILCADVYSQEVKISKRSEYLSGGMVNEVYYVKKRDKQVKHGSYKYYYNDSLMVSGYYQDNQLNDDWGFYYDNGRIIQSGKFLNGEKEGIWVVTIGDTLASKIFYSNGDPDSAISFYVDGTPMSKKYYRTGNKEGAHYTFFDDGSIRSLKYYKQGLLDGQFTVYHPNGNIHICAQYIEGFVNDTTSILTENGNEIIKAVFNMGRLDEVLEYNLHNGNKLFFGDFSGGNGSLVTYYFDEHGKLTDHKYCVAHFENGYINGGVVFYNQNGQIKSKGECYNSIKKGIWKIRTSNAFAEFDYGSGMLKPIDLIEIESLFVGGRKSFEEPIISQYGHFPGGALNFYKFLSKTIRYPYIAKRDGIQGLVLVQYEIDELGFTSNFEILHSAGPELDKEALRVIKMVPLHTPCLINNFPAKMGINAPVRFTLQ